jgi:hypothetical protein
MSKGLRKSEENKTEDEVAAVNIVDAVDSNDEEDEEKEVL